MKLLKTIVANFKRDHANFLGAKFIFSVSRNTGSELPNVLSLYQQLRTEHPDFIIGLDFNGQEDVGTPLSDFSEDLLPLSLNTNFFLHAGETSNVLKIIKKKLRLIL